MCPATGGDHTWTTLEERDPSDPNNTIRHTACSQCGARP